MTYHPTRPGMYATPPPEEKEENKVKVTRFTLMQPQGSQQQTNPPGVGTWLGFNFYDLRG